MKMSKKWITAFITLSSLQAMAQGVVGDDLTMKKRADDLKLAEGWTPDLKLMLNTSYGTSNNVIGQVNGETVTYGGKLSAAYSYKGGLNEWRNLLDYVGSTSKTAAVPMFIKSSDMLSFNSTYLRSIESHPWLGPYAMFDLKTPVFKGEDRRVNPVAYNEKSTGANIGNGTSLRLTDGFEPLRTKESVGFFAKFIETDKTLLEGRLGYGALQIKVDGWAIDDDAATANIIELKKLTGYNYSGFELGLNAQHKLDERTTLALLANMLIPVSFTQPQGKSLSNVEAADVDIKGSLTSKLSDWLTFAYEIKAIKQPLLLDKFQVQTLGTLNFTHDFL